MARLPPLEKLSLAARKNRKLAVLRGSMILSALTKGV